MITLDDLRLMDALSHAGSLSGAARALNVTPPALSMRLKKLEQSLGLSLVVRNSRHARFTEEGERLVAEAQTLLAHMNALPDALYTDGRRLAGRLRIVASFGFGRIHVAPIVAEFATMHPSLHITLDLSETPWTASSGADVVVHIGAVRDSSWIAHMLARNERWICASPDYLRTCRMPTEPRDLLSHKCLCVRENEEDVTLWRYRKASKGNAARNRAEAVRVTPALTSNDGEVVRNWAIAGLGVALRSQWDVAPFVKSGHLQRLLTPWTFEPADILALVPARHGISARVSRFIDFLKARFRGQAPWRRL
jgi:DNA-binding transcriptional LysR family regulator